MFFLNPRKVTFIPCFVSCIIVTYQLFLYCLCVTKHSWQTNNHLIFIYNEQTNFNPILDYGIKDILRSE
jgi:hypothetical protein